MKDFELKFSGLALGKHQFKFETNKTFFENFQDRGLEGEIIHYGAISFLVDLDKKENLLVFDISFTGVVTVTCDLCLDDLRKKVNGSHRILGKFGDEDQWREEDVIMIPPKEHKVQMEDIFFELVILSLPSKLVHEEGDCDPEMLKKLNEYNLGGEVETKEETDPRWNALKDLFKDKK